MRKPPLYYPPVDFCTFFLGSRPLEQAIFKKLAAIVGPEHLLTAPEELACYAYDGSAREFLPQAVLFPANTAEIAAIMRLANEARFPVTPRGAGTGMTGGALAVNGGVVLAMGRLNRIIEIDPDNQLAVVAPGVITGVLQDEVKRRGLYYPPDPASRQFCTIGGNVACGAGGPSAVKYGVTRDYVLGLQAVLASGEIIRTGVRTAKGVVGYDLTRLLTGSEGTLAVITEITLRLLPQPVGRSTFLILCRDLLQAAGLVSEILRHMTPCTLEFMDRTALALVADRLSHPLPPATGALLLLELDGDQAEVSSQRQQLRQLLSDRPGISLQEAADPAEAEELWAARRAISPAAFQLRPHKISEDVVVPRNRIPELVAIAHELGRKKEVAIFTFGHAGDGNIHVNIMLDRNNPAETSRAEAARDALFDAVLKLGGTISGEHGIGLSKAGVIGREIEPVALALMRAIKQTFDPYQILNPGKIFQD